MSLTILLPPSTGYCLVSKPIRISFPDIEKECKGSVDLFVLERIFQQKNREKVLDLWFPRTNSDNENDTKEKEIENDTKEKEIENDEDNQKENDEKTKNEKNYNDKKENDKKKRKKKKENDVREYISSMLEAKKLGLYILIPDNRTLLRLQREDMWEWLLSPIQRENQLMLEKWKQICWEPKTGPILFLIPHQCKDNSSWLLEQAFLVHSKMFHEIAHLRRTVLRDFLDKQLQQANTHLDYDDDKNIFVGIKTLTVVFPKMYTTPNGAVQHEHVIVSKIPFVEQTRKEVFRMESENCPLVLHLRPSSCTSTPLILPHSALATMFWVIFPGSVAYLLNFRESLTQKSVSYTDVATYNSGIDLSLFIYRIVSFDERAWPWKVLWLHDVLPSHFCLPSTQIFLPVIIHSEDMQTMKIAEIPIFCCDAIQFSTGTFRSQTPPRPSLLKNDNDFVEMAVHRTSDGLFEVGAHLINDLTSPTPHSICPFCSKDVDPQKVSVWIAPECNHSQPGRLCVCSFAMHVRRLGWRYDCWPIFAHEEFYQFVLDESSSSSTKLEVFSLDKSALKTHEVLRKNLISSPSSPSHSSYSSHSYSTLEIYDNNEDERARRKRERAKQRKQEQKRKKQESSKTKKTLIVNNNTTQQKQNDVSDENQRYNSNTDPCPMDESDELHFTSFTNKKTPSLSMDSAVLSTAINLSTSSPHFTPLPVITLPKTTLTPLSITSTPFTTDPLTSTPLTAATTTTTTTTIATTSIPFATSSTISSMSSSATSSSLSSSISTSSTNLSNSSLHNTSSTAKSSNSLSLTKLSRNNNASSSTIKSSNSLSTINSVDVPSSSSSSTSSSWVSRCFPKSNLRNSTKPLSDYKKLCSSSSSSLSSSSLSSSSLSSSSLPSSSLSSSSLSMSSPSTMSTVSSCVTLLPDVTSPLQADTNTPKDLMMATTYDLHAKQKRSGNKFKNPSLTDKEYSLCMSTQQSKASPITSTDVLRRENDESSQLSSTCSDLKEQGNKRPSDSTTTTMVQQPIQEHQTIQQEPIQQEPIQQEPIQQHQISYQQSIQQEHEPIQQQPIQKEHELIQKEPIQQHQISYQQSIQQEHEPIQEQSIQQEHEPIQQQPIQQQPIQQQPIQQQPIQQQPIQQQPIQQQPIQQQPFQQEQIYHQEDKMIQTINEEVDNKENEKLQVVDKHNNTSESDFHCTAFEMQNPLFPRAVLPYSRDGANRYRILLAQCDEQHLIATNAQCVLTSTFHAWPDQYFPIFYNIQNKRWVFQLPPPAIFSTVSPPDNLRHLKQPLVPLRAEQTLPEISETTNLVVMVCSPYILPSNTEIFAFRAPMRWSSCFGYVPPVELPIAICI